MPRSARIVAVGFPHHITQRGNFQQNIFEDNGDKERYLHWIQEYADRYKLSIMAYCLMPNHTHFIAIPHKNDSLARAFNAAHMRYAQYANKKMKRNGHLWQGRFFSCVLSDEHLVAAARYIERNPVRAKLVDKPWQWKWSSAAAHTKKGISAIRLSDFFNIIGMDAAEWEKCISSGEEEKALQAIKKHTLAGRPLGSEEFLKKLGERLQVKFPLLDRGRPRKNSGKE